MHVVVSLSSLFKSLFGLHFLSLHLLRFAFVEFNEHRSMNLALRLNGGMLGGRPIK